MKRAFSAVALCFLLGLFATAQAQNLQLYDSTGTTAVSSITITPPSTGVAAPQTFTLKPATGSGPVFFNPPVLTISGLPSFFRAVASSNSTSSTTAATITIIQDVPVTTGQTYQGTLSITPAGGSTAYTVAVRIGPSGSQGGTLTVDKLNMTFNVPSGQVASDSLTVNSVSGSSIVFGASVTTANGGSWLSVFPATATTSSVPNLFVAVNATGLTNGTYSGTITLTPSSGNVTTVNVTMTVGTGGGGTAGLTVSPSSLSFNILGSALASQNVTVSATAPTTFTVSNPNGTPWLSAFAMSSTTNTTVVVTVIPTALPSSGGFSVVRLTTAAGSQDIPVTAIFGGSGSGNASANPATLALTANAGSKSATSTVSLTSTPSGTFYNQGVTYTNGSGWLNVTDSVSGFQSGTTPATLNVIADATGLQAGTYQANIGVTVFTSPTSTVNIPVTLTVSALSVTPASLSFTGTAGSSATPADQNISLTGTTAGASFTASAVATSCGGNWLTVTPASGTTSNASPATASVAVHVATAGIPITGSSQTCTGTVTITSGGGSSTVNVTLTAQAAPRPAITTIQNGASFLPGPIAPGELITLKGSNLGPATGVSFTLDANNLVPTTLSNVQVLMDNTAIPLIYVSTNQINAIVPYEMAGRASTSVEVKVNGISSAAISQSVATTVPGIFAYPSGSTQAALLNANGTVNGATAPATKGTFVAVYATGEGTVTPLPTTGSVTRSTPPFPQLLNGPVTVKVGGVALDPSDVVYAGPAPALVAGVIQINFRVPDFVSPSNAVPLTVVIGGKESAGLTFAVK